MIEKTIYDYLTEAASVPVYMTRPADLSGVTSYIMVEKTGSSRANYIETATLAVQSYAPTIYEAAVLNEEVKKLMLDAISLDEISSSKLVSDYNFTNTQTKQPRYQAVFDVTYY